MMCVNALTSRRACGSRHDRFLCRGKQPLQCLLVGCQTLPAPVPRQVIPYILAQAEPGTIGIVEIHQLAPYGRRQPEGGFFVPGNLCDLQISRGGLIEDRAAEQKTERNLAVFQSIEILRGCQTEVVTARHCQVHATVACKWRHHDANVRPEQGPQRLAPTLRRAEQVEKPFPFSRGVAPPAGLEAYLTTKHHGVNG